jgi:hypothetical protein
MQEKNEKLVLVGFIDGTVRLVPESEVTTNASSVEYDAD